MFWDRMTSVVAALKETRMSTPSKTVAAELLTLRDFLRHAVSQFTAANLVFGHGTTTALDDAAFLLLEALHLPVDSLEPWLDARLLPDERLKLSGLIEQRVTTRKPSAYLVKKAYIQGVPFYVDERVIVPRSFIGELLMGDKLMSDEGLITDPAGISRVLDLCTGSGCLAILAAGCFPSARVDAVELSEDALAVARRNVEEHGLTDRIRLLQGDLFAPVTGETYDLIIANPPYVSQQVVDAFPPEYRAEPQMAHLSGKDGLDISRRIVREAKKHLTRNGAILCEIGEDREILEDEFPDVPFLWLDTEESSGEVFWAERKGLNL
jgi:ribosomal protein L3 glutamine methyltransferase